MRPHTLKRQHYIERPIWEVFAFFSKPENLAAITPDEMDFKMLTPSPISMHTGALIDYSIRVFGFRVRWTTLITRFDPPSSFIDVQVRGPYAYWHHTHSFEMAGGGTLMTDEVRYALPLGPLGWLIHGPLVRRQLDRIFDHRARMLDKVFPAGKEPAAVDSASENEAWKGKNR